MANTLSNPIRYFVDYDRCYCQYTPEWLTEEFMTKYDVLDFCNNMQSDYPDCSFRITKGTEIKLKAETKITKYVFDD